MRVSFIRVARCIAVLGLFALLLVSQVGFAWRQSTNAWPCLVEGDGWATTTAGCKDPSGLVWSKTLYETLNAMAYWSDAKSYCSNLVEGAKPDGTPADDWRMPTKDEMIVAYRAGGKTHLNYYHKAGSPEVDPSFTGWHRWTSTVGKNKRQTYVVNMDNGEVALWGNGNDYWRDSWTDTWCVRGR